RELQNRRRREDLDDKLADDKPLADALENILRTNPMLEKLFLHGQGISTPFPSTGGAAGGTNADFHGKPFPTYFRFKGKADGAEGDSIKFEIEVSDIAHIDPLVNPVTLKVVRPSEKNGGGGGGGARNANKGRGTKGTSSGLALPTVHRVTEKDRNKSFHNFED